MTKQTMISALRAFISQRSGIDYRNYQSGDWKASHEAFMGDYRPILRAGRDARVLLAAVSGRDGITAENLREASRAYSGRLQFIEPKTGEIFIDYTTGQYFPTEYRNAACAVLLPFGITPESKATKTATRSANGRVLSSGAALLHAGSTNLTQARGH